MRGTKALAALTYGIRLRMAQESELKQMWTDTRDQGDRPRHRQVAQEIARRDPRNRRAMPAIS